MITQREAVDSYGTPIDILESFYVAFFESLGLELIIVSNFHRDIRNLLKKDQFDFAILTGGGAIPPKYYEEYCSDSLQSKRDNIERIIIEYFTANEIPIIGICRGRQYINGFYGGKVSKLKDLNVQRPIGIDHPVKIGNIETIYVNNYHNDGIYTKNLSKEFKVLAVDEENDIVESFYSNEKRILCVQWHPERKFKNKKGFKRNIEIISNFIKTGGYINESNYFSRWAGD